MYIARWIQLQCCFTRLSDWSSRLPYIWGGSTASQGEDWCWCRLHHHTTLLWGGCVLPVCPRLQRDRHHVSHFPRNDAYPGFYSLLCSMLNGNDNAVTCTFLHENSNNKNSLYSTIKVKLGHITMQSIMCGLLSPCSTVSVPVCLSVSHRCEPYKNGWTSRGAVLFRRLLYKLTYRFGIFKHFLSFAILPLSLVCITVVII